MSTNQIKITSVLVVIIVIAILPSIVSAKIIMNQTSPSYDFGTSLVNHQYTERTATLYFTNTSAKAQKGKISLSAANTDIQIVATVIDIYVNPGETVEGFVEIEFTPTSVGQFFETIAITTDFGATSKQSIIAACYNGSRIEGNIHDYITKEVIPASECTSPAFNIFNNTGKFSGHWFAGSYEFTVSADGYHSTVKHIYLPENGKVPWNPELVPVITLSDAISELRAASGTTDPQLTSKIDLNQDGQLCVEETILYLQVLADLRQQDKYHPTSYPRSLSKLQKHPIQSPQ
jgi:hypothetical protein